jgi:fructosamine-3-kinase
VDGQGQNVLCKYEQFLVSNAQNHGSWGHRRGNGYEADVYRRLLDPMGVAAPRYFGAHSDNRTGTRTLFLEYLEGAQHPKDHAAWREVATWLARFHRDAKPFASSNDATFLIRYDRDYYVGWAHRAVAFAEPLRERYPWMPDVCRRFAGHGAPGFESHPTVIHGECYRKNLLIHRGHVYAIDWESCAIGAAEVDVAMLAETCPKDLIDEIEGRYMRERWPDGVAGNFSQRLAMAKVYVQLRWLGDHPDRTGNDSFWWRFDELRVASQMAGLLS